jgi:hypothetical protein
VKKAKKTGRQLRQNTERKGSHVTDPEIEPEAKNESAVFAYRIRFIWVSAQLNKDEDICAYKRELPENAP